MRDRQSIEQAKEEERKYKLHLLEKQKNDLQITLQVKSVVRVRNSNGGGGDGSGDERRRAKLVKTAGVPGLSRVLVCYEGLDYSKNVKDATSVKKGDLVLVDRIELEKDPFREGNANASANACAKSPKTDSDNRDSKRTKREDDQTRGTRTSTGTRTQSPSPTRRRSDR